MGEEYRIRVVDGFCWLVVTGYCYELNTYIELYRIYDDGSESLLKNRLDISAVLLSGNDIYVELGKYVLFSRVFEKISSILKVKQIKKTN